MEMDFAASAETEQDALEVDDYNNNDGNNFGGERCGICMDIVIDRGVLDCCQHWFCFGCIDNWATITNLCPLCQNEFQLITCVPVYDTIGSSKVDEDSYSRDDDWFVEGKNNSLSFPSYYIDENAVICLDGDGCKIRNGSVTAEGDSDLDTSIACDSCDIWYHAFCVGFDPEGTSESTWLCPRCVVDEIPQQPDRNSEQNCDSLSGARNANKDQLAEDTYARKVSISVADSGETAIVVSMVEGNRLTEEPEENNLSTVEVEAGKELKTQTFMLTSEDNSQNLTTQSEEKSVTKPVLKTQELELSLSCETPHSSSSPFKVKRELITSDTTINDYSGSNCSKNSPGEVANTSHFGKNPFDGSSDMGLHLGLSVGSFLSADKLNKSVSEDQIEDIELHNPIEECAPRADESAGDPNKLPFGTTGLKRKHLDNSYSVNDCDHIHLNASVDANTEISNEVSQKKIRADERIQLTLSDDDVNVSASDVSENVKDADSGNDRPKPLLEKENGVPSRTSDKKEKENGVADIMSIVQGTKRKPSKGLRRRNTDDKSSQDLESSAGLRVKKIMKRAGEDNESSMAVQKLRKEIREAVRNKTVKDLGENLFDPKLLAAFRAAVAGPKPESSKALSQMAVKARKSMLQKGKVRENLTKKIYASNNGRRKRAWDRDCEVEFWKYRCMKASRPEKIQTLTSVLDLLRSGSESTETGQQSERQSQSTDPILSRLYLADTSVFPRKEDIKPLAALKTSGDSEVRNKQPSLAEKRLKLSFDSSISQVNDDKGPSKVLKKNIVPSLKVGAAASKVPLNRNTEGLSLPSSGNSKSSTQKETAPKPEDIRSDKRKWALEVLARRTSGSGDGVANGNKEDNAVLKGNYPLLAQLPVEMRPVLALSRHNKIPISVRQAQLYRLTEHLLRKANIPVIRRTAETELAVADAINIEREVADRSNSKLVYMNLCAQELVHRSENSKASGAAETENSIPSTDPIERSEISETDIPTDPVVQEALKNAGLLSDSPPNSPNHETDNQSEEGEPSTNDKDEGPEDVFEMGDAPDLDIYGEFEYNLDDEDYIGVSAAKVSSVQAEESASKMKLVFSTLQCERSNNTRDSEKPASSASADIDSELPNSFSNVLEGQIDTRLNNSTMTGETKDASVPQESLYGKEGEEPSIAECEELYGPDTEPLKQLPEEGPTKLYGSGNSEAMPNQAETSTSVGHNSSAGESSPTRLETGETVRNKEKKSNSGSVKVKPTDISKKVEAYIKEHIRPLCKSGVITAEQYRWAVSKATEKVMKYHSKAKNANFLIKEGEKVKKLAEQYVEAAKPKE